MLESARKSKHLSQAAIGKSLQVSQSYVSRIERGKVTNVDSIKIVKLAKLLDLCPIDVFLFVTKYDHSLCPECCKKQHYLCF